jgi:hypothetical protein
MLHTIRLTVFVLILGLCACTVHAQRRGQCPVTEVQLRVVQLQDSLRQNDPQTPLPEAELQVVLILPSHADTALCVQRPTLSYARFSSKLLLYTSTPMPRPLLVGVVYRQQRMALVLPGTNPAGYALGNLPFQAGGVFVFKYFDFWDTGRNTRQNLLDVLQREPNQRFQHTERLRASPAEDMLTAQHLQALQLWLEADTSVTTWGFQPKRQR